MPFLLCSIVIVFEKTVFDAVLFVGYHRFQMHVFNTPEYALFNVGIALFKLADKLFCLLTFAVILSVVAACACVCKLAGALDEVQLVVVAPRFYIVFSHEIERTDKFHPFKIGAVQLWHHGLNLRPVQHAHKDCFDHVVIVVSQRDFVAAELFCKVVQISPSHPCAKIARRFVHVVHALENVRLEHGDRHVEPSRVLFDDTAVFGRIAGVHDKIFHVKIHVAVAF